MIPTQVLATSGWIPPWFQAKVWFGGGAVLGRNTQAVPPVVVVKSHGVADDALRK